ncbi:DNA-binding transcriptional regulator, MarR family [Leuconostocaceae bacterium R-53105]|nr:DNA-binding transcriptional regulator, MarR family [Leuconostocaceae bacterium R-53105]
MKKRMNEPVTTFNFEETNRELVEVFTNVMWVEESAIRKGPFFDLSVKEVHTIDAISMYEHKSASEVAKLIHLTPSAMTTAIDRLVEKGYVERCRSKRDRRVVELALTHVGRVVYRAHQEFHRGLTHSLFENMSTHEISTLQRAIHNLKHYLISLI